MLCLDDSVDGPRLPFLRAQVASMLWALGLDLGRRDGRFHDGANDVGTASWSTDNPHLLAAAAPAFERREGSHFATGQRPHHSTVSRPYRASRIV